MTALPDAQDRLLAETVFDRNIVVIAGAGTGKTTLLVNRLIHGLLREPNAFAITEMVALTFTNKAANEMKIRLHERLQALLQSIMNLRGGMPNSQIQEFCDRYHLSLDHLRMKIQQALRDLDQAHIRTLHSFAAHILRLFPLESGVDPHFQEDDGSQFNEIFQSSWSDWLEEELGPSGKQKALWTSLLQVLSLEDIREFALGLCDDSISSSEFHQQISSSQPTNVFLEWVKAKHQQVRVLLEAYSTSNKPRKVEKMLRVAATVLEGVAQHGEKGDLSLSAEEISLLERSPGKPPQGWQEEDFQQASRLLLTVSRLLRVKNHFLMKVTQLLRPIVERVQRDYSQQGWIRFEGLVVRVRNVLRDNPSVRRELKRNFRAFLVDEFQDTDPLQYEIVLYLSEVLGQETGEWRDISLVPGKLFIVGDPKQSIYAFRRADIEAFDQVLKKLVQDGACICRLTTNFRSTPGILNVVNDVFARLFVPVPNVQPPNIPLDAGRSSMEESESGSVELCVVTHEDRKSEWDSEKATRVEAQWLARWIQGQLSHGQSGIMEDGVKRDLRPGHIAILFRNFTNAHVYFEALHREGVAYVTDDARHFYRRQEVIDFVNLLRVLDDPHDSIAVIGILRSSLGGVPDQDIMELVKLGLWKNPDDLEWSKWTSATKAPVRALFAKLRKLAQHARHLPIPELLDQVFMELPLVELAAASSHGEQAVVNLWKLRDRMNEQAALPSMSFSTCVDRFVHSVSTEVREPESPLFEETLDAVRVLTIHKAKGLEFPIVILPGLHQKNKGPVWETGVSYDWMTGVYGCRLSTVSNGEQVLLDEKQRVREEAEQRRILYVGMTRARDRLVLSGGLLDRKSRDNFWGLLGPLSDEKLGDPQYSIVRLGEREIPQVVVTPDLIDKNRVSVPGNSQAEKENVNAKSPDWSDRTKVWQCASQMPGFSVPSAIHGIKTVRRGFHPSTSGKMEQKHLGTWVHRFLEQWNFKNDAMQLQGALRDFLRHHDLPEHLGRDVLLEEMLEVLHPFLRSPGYHELSEARIIGREVPFLMNWPIESGFTSLPRSGVMEGVVDVVYECRGEYWVGDYKTDRITFEAERKEAERYREQAKVYIVAMKQSLGLDVQGCKLFFLRSGMVVPIEIHQKDIV